MKMFKGIIAIVFIAIFAVLVVVAGYILSRPVEQESDKWLPPRAGQTLLSAFTGQSKKKQYCAYYRDNSGSTIHSEAEEKSYWQETAEHAKAYALEAPPGSIFELYTMSQVDGLPPPLLSFTVPKSRRERRLEADKLEKAVFTKGLETTLHPPVIPGSPILEDVCALSTRAVTLAEVSCIVGETDTEQVSRLVKTSDILTDNQEPGIQKVLGLLPPFKGEAPSRVTIVRLPHNAAHGRSYKGDSDKYLSFIEKVLERWSLTDVEDTQFRAATQGI